MAKLSELVNTSKIPNAQELLSKFANQKTAIRIERVLSEQQILKQSKYPKDIDKIIIQPWSYFKEIATRWS